MQILASPELRKQYDAHGSAGLDANLVNGALFFTCLFGSDRFEHLIGELLIAVAARSGGDLNMAEMKEVQVGLMQPDPARKPLFPAAARLLTCCQHMQSSAPGCNPVWVAHMTCGCGRPSGWRHWWSC